VKKTQSISYGLGAVRAEEEAALLLLAAAIYYPILIW
jgi:hypothetical protein